jgi:hypothetical protein
MAYPINIKNKAINLRKQGLSIENIAKTLNIAKSTASVWLSKIPLDKTALKRLSDNQIVGQYKTAQIRKEKTKKQTKEDEVFAKGILKSIRFNSNIDLLCCALLYWAEGSKTSSSIGFTNSDPKMISTFIELFRKSFSGLDESKFRCLVHIHEYHDDQKIKQFWSAITDIPVSQFQNSYLKPHSGKRKKAGYHGTLSLRYYDSRVVQKLKAIYNMFTTHLGV